MHDTRNTVQISPDEIERILTARAVPDFTGNVSIEIRVLPTAGQEVEFKAEIESHAPLSRSQEKAAPIISNDRVYAVREAIRANAHRFVIGTRIVAVKASFLRGELKSFKICEVEDGSERQRATAS